MFLPMQCYASMVLAMALCLSVCPSQASIVLKWLNRSSIVFIVCGVVVEFGVSPGIRVLPSGTFYQLLPSTTIHSILPVQITCLAIFLHSLSPCPISEVLTVCIIINGDCRCCVFLTSTCADYRMKTSYWRLFIFRNETVIVHLPSTKFRVYLTSCAEQSNVSRWYIHNNHFTALLMVYSTVIIP